MVTRTAVDTNVVVRIIKKILDKQFGDEFVFDPIIVEQRFLNEFDEEDEYLRIVIVFDGDWKRLDPRWTLTLASLMRPAMREMGWDIPIVKSFVEKVEWEKFEKMKDESGRSY